MSRLARGAQQAEAWLETRLAGWLLLAAFAAWYTWAYAHHSLNPGNAPVEQRIGWWSWADQYKYLQSALALAAGDFGPERHLYPVGYAALAVPFLRWLPTQPFFVPDLLLMLGAAYFAWRLLRRWLPAGVTIALAAVFLFTHRDLIELTMVVPWNTLATQCLLLAGIWTLVTVPGRRAVWWLALAAAAAWWVRPIDALTFAPLLVCAVLRLHDWPTRVGHALGGMAVIAASVVAMGLLNRSIFGTWRTPYEQAAFTMVGFFDYPLGQKLYWTFLDARPFFGETDAALLPRYPWLVLAVPGLVFWVRRDGAAGLAVVLTLALSWLLYLGYNDFFPSSFFRYSLIHYVAWSFVPLLVAAAGALRGGWKYRSVRVGWGLAGGVVILALGLRLEERALPVAAVPGAVSALPPARPLWVRFPGVSLDQVTALRLDGRAMTEAADYQIPYVPSDLKVLLGDRARGTKLALPAGATVPPQAGDYRWAWHWRWSR